MKNISVNELSYEFLKQGEVITIAIIDNKNNPNYPARSHGLKPQQVFKRV